MNRSLTMLGVAYAGAHVAPSQHRQQKEEHGAAVPQHQTQMSAAWRPRTEMCKRPALPAKAAALLHCNIAVGVLDLFVMLQTRNPVTIGLV